MKSWVNREVGGIEYGCVLKNVYGIGGGMWRGVKYGEKLEGVVVWNGLEEMKGLLDRVDGVKGCRKD